MVRPQNDLDSLRFSRLEKERLLLALLFSLLVHLAIWGGYAAEKKTGWWEKLFPPARHKLVLLTPKPVMPEVDPTIFVDVSQASADAPKEAKYYSDKNSRAANPDATVESNQPKLNGRQPFVPKTEDAPRPTKAKPPEPAPTPPQKPVEEKPAEESKPATALNPGALQPGKPTETTTPDEKPTPPERPRTIREALAQQSTQLPGQQMQQDGGVKRRALTSSLDAMSTSFGAYDRAIVSAISQRWYDLLDNQNFADSRTGKVTVYFHLNTDGSVSELKTTDNSVGDLLGYLCQEAIQQAAPFGPWPSDMRLKIGTTYREITFTFYYY
jgi:outer membrane biosynthesis protein TonB